MSKCILHTLFAANRWNVLNWSFITI